MGLWSSIKKAAKKVWRAAKAVVRVVVRAVIEVLNRLTFGLLDLVFGFFAWPRKRLRLHVFILWSETPPVIEGNPAPPIEQVVQDAIEVTKRIYKERFNVDVLPYSKSFIQVIHDSAARCLLQPRHRVHRGGGVLRRPPCGLERHTDYRDLARDRVRGARPQGF